MNEKGIDTKIYKILAYFPLLWVVGYLSPYHNDHDVRFHVNQGINLTAFVAAAVLVVELIINLVVLKVFNREQIIFGAKTGIYVTTPLGNGIVIGLWVLLIGIYAIFTMIGIRNVLKNREKRLPYIGDVINLR